MNKIKILKNVSMSKISETNDDYYYFSIAKLASEYDSSIKSNLFSILTYCGISLIPIIEDFIIIALSIYAVDKRFVRNKSSDSWTRNFKLEIPVIEKEKWDNVACKLNQTLGFLSGDIWEIIFYSTTERIEKQKNIKRVLPDDFEIISLFSGGLDSYCGAIDLLGTDTKVLFVGNEEYPKLQTRQNELIDILRKEYSAANFMIKTFTAQSQSYFLEGRTSKNTENTSRTRSLLFVAAGVVFASAMNKPNIPIYIPENGFIGLNLPLTPSRMGSCSTRTTHPRFINELNEILNQAGIQNKIINPFKFLSKTAVVNKVKDTMAFKKGVDLTISCSHPTLPRWRGRTYPKNCGYCYPCLIRRSSVKHLELSEKYEYDINTQFYLLRDNDKKGDILAMLNALSNYKKYGRDYVKQRIIVEGTIDANEIENFVSLYEETFNSFQNVITAKELKDFAGIK